MDTPGEVQLPPGVGLRNLGVEIGVGRIRFIYCPMDTVLQSQVKTTHTVYYKNESHATLHLH